MFSDNGVGLPDTLDWTKSRSLGLRLVQVLAQQLRGNLDIRSQDGTEVKLVFTASSSLAAAARHGSHC